MTGLLSPKETRHPSLRSIAVETEGEFVACGRERLRCEKISTREPYGSMSSPTEVPPSGRAKTSAARTRPVIGSHHSACRPVTRNVALTFRRTFDVLATK